MDYPIPSATQRIEIVVVNSRFVATSGHADTVDHARAFIADVRAEMPDASHHVYAFRIGYGNSVIEGMSDDGEPTGTAGPPALATLRGTDIGDTVLVISRYFGGTKLGTGGLVRAYSAAARDVLDQLPRKLRTEYVQLGLECPYPLYENVKRLVLESGCIIEDESFTSEVTLFLRIPVAQEDAFTEALTELSSGTIQPIKLGRVQD